ncbi:MAG: FlgD immunoglobulin-like domain containing protein, partial [Bacteroidota bacterium]
YGCTEEVIICCTDENANFDSEPPQVEVMMDDENWIDGSYVSNTPLLLALCSDDQGINTTGLGVGRDLTAVLNNERDEPIILNNFYKTEKGSYNTGRIEYPMNELAPGMYTLEVKIWDVTNNSATDQTTFIVADDAKLALEGVLNFPNPFTESTTFRFNHNLAGEEIVADVLIYDQRGQRVKHLREDFTPTSAISDDITWDGTTDTGNPITSGVYVYKLRLTVKATGEEIGASNRLVYIRQ